MSVLSPIEVVRLMLEAQANGNVRRVLKLVDPEVWATIGPGGAARVEVDAHRLEAEGEESVRVDGRIRVIDGGSLTDSPGAWRFTVGGGRVLAIATLGSRRAGVRPAA